MQMQIPGLQNYMRGVMKKVRKKKNGVTLKTEKPLGTHGLKLSLMKSIRGGIDNSGQFNLRGK